jgi:hypothetical protein
MISDIYNDRWATAVLVLHAVAVAILAAGAAAAALPVLQAGGLLLAFAAAGHFTALAHILWAPHTAAARPPAVEKVAV